jgi:hypothetical protein
MIPVYVVHRYSLKVAQHIKLKYVAVVVIFNFDKQLC